MAFPFPSIDAGFKDQHESHEQALPEIDAYDQKLHDLQYLMYAQGERSPQKWKERQEKVGRAGLTFSGYLIARR